MKKMETDFQAIVRSVIDACSDCDTCRFLMNEDCLFFPEMYRMVDWEKESGRHASSRDLKKLIELCTLCGLCPCPNIRNDVIRAKSALVRSNGMPLSNRLLADIQKLGHTCGMASRLSNAILSNDHVKGVVKRIAGIHPERNLPRIPGKNFFTWANDRGLCSTHANGHGIAYFAGCTAGYLFPEVGQAAVKVLEHNGVPVFVPPQQCCGMPTLVEGDASTTLRRTKSNIDAILAAKDRGFKPVGSCPTCGFLMRVLMKEGAYHSESFQRAIGADDHEIKIPNEQDEGQFIHLKKSFYGDILKDDGLFNALDPMDRIELSDWYCDIGEYLLRLHEKRNLNISFRTIAARMVYFAPCHQREQKIGSPYLELLSIIPGLSIEQVGGSMDCCGMGGSLGYKKGFHEQSESLGGNLAAKIRRASPDTVITDCLSCRLQFQHMLPFPVFHPLEILLLAYEGR
jgi:glycerol-3-phosphate dehydrogenase subunit C